MCIFFFSSRRRHTRLQGDWSSDVCSSDLLRPLIKALSAVFSFGASRITTASYLPNVQYACNRLPPSRFKCSQFLSISAIVSLVGFFLHFAKLTNIVLISPSTHSWVFSKPLFGIQIPFSSRCRISFLRWPE